MVRSDLAFTLLRPVSETSWPWRGGDKVEGGWRTPELTAAEDSNTEFIAVDCLGLIGGCDGLILSEFGRNTLEPLIGSAGELLPVIVSGRQYWWFNCLDCLEALDRDATEADWSVVEGEWGSFRWITSTRRLAFSVAKVGAAPALFRIPEYPQGVLFGTDEFAEAVVRDGLTGFSLDHVWSDVGGGIVDPPSVGLAGLFDGDGVEEQTRRRAHAVSVLGQRDGR